MHIMKPQKSGRSTEFVGEVVVPGDKSISHRALLIASQAIGESSIEGLLEGDDVLATASALRLMGVGVKRISEGRWKVNGVGVGGLQEPEDVLNVGNSGTGARLLMGLLSSYSFLSVITGDDSLRKRPMNRVITPLEEMGVHIISHSGGTLPACVVGDSEIIPIDYTLPVASAQVKTAILLAALNCPGITTVVEPSLTRDHTELMLRSFGAKVDVSQKQGKNHIELTGYPELIAQDIVVPGDPSSAAFLVAAALLVPGSRLIIKNVCVNPLRIGFYTTLKEMGADIEFQNERLISEERVADICVTSSALEGVAVPPERVPSMIDEFPILAVISACAEGVTTMEGLEELKVKESNRLSAIAKGLEDCGVKIDMGDTSLRVYGGEVYGGARVETFFDHRIAMSFLVLGMVSKQPIEIDDITMVNTSFPDFKDCCNRLGACIEDG